MERADAWDQSLRDAAEAEAAAARERYEVTPERVLRELAGIAYDPLAERFARLQALRSLGDHLGLWRPRQIELTGRDGGPLEVARATDAALLAELARLASALPGPAAPGHGQAGVSSGRDDLPRGLPDCPPDGPTLTVEPDSVRVDQRFG